MRGLIIRHVAARPQVLRRHDIDAVTLLAPRQPVLVEMTCRGHTTKRVMRRGDICVVPPLVEAQYRLGPIDAVMAWLPSSLMRRAARTLELSEAAIRLTPLVRDPLIAALAAELWVELAGASATALYRNALALGLLGRLFKRYAEGDPIGHVATDDARIARALAFVDGHVGEDIEVADVARQAGLSGPHLSELFKAATGETVWGYVQRRRLHHARALLAQSQASIADISELVGYASTPHFATSFKRAFGVTPTQYRRTAQSA